MAELSLIGISRRYGDTMAVADVSIEVADGEFVVLVGPSGCGKTTTLRILAGLETASAGRVAIGGRDMTDVEAKDRNLAMVFQSYALYPHMSVGETIGFSLRLQGLPRREIAAAVQAAADRLEIGHLLGRKPRDLSGGQRQRVAVARCIVRQPHAFLFDEPLSNLDARLRATARVEIAKLQKSLGVTSVYVTHDQVEAMTMADRIVLMEAGRIRQVGTPMDLYRRPRDVFTATFLGAPPMNMVRGTVAAGTFTAGPVRVPVPCGVPDGPTTLGLRPEALGLDPRADGIAFPGEVSHVEQLGAESVVELRADGVAEHPLILRLPAQVAAPAAGAHVTATAALDQAHFFDAADLRIAPLG